MTASEPPLPATTKTIDTAIDLLAAGARRVAEWLKRLGVIALVAGVTVWLLVGTYLLTWSSWWPIASVVGGVLLLVPGPALFIERHRLIVAADNDANIKEDVHRLLHHASDPSGIVDRFTEAADRVGTKASLRTLVAAGRELLPVVRFAREQQERYDSLLESVSAFSMARLTWAATGAVLEIVVLPIAIVTGFVFWVF